ncbi:MAG: Fic family protein [Pyrinomonadaceae bacterium]
MGRKNSLALNVQDIIDPRNADAAYKSFPPFDEWSKCIVDSNRWDRYSQQIKSRSDLSPALLKRAQEVVAKVAAIDTGAIEGLYETDRGFTFTVATEAALWQAVVEEKKGPRVRALIESQLNAYDYVLDFATRQVPLGEAWIRVLHQQICKNQDTYSAYTELGIQELPLPKGEYKHLPNHVLTPDGNIHSYAPVDLTPAEMHRLIQEINSEQFLNAHPVLQSSYAHYALAAIHPFADGNGRLARALSSVFTYRAVSIPLLILSENRGEYLSSLRLADEGNLQAFVDFTLDKALGGIRLFDESLRGAAVHPAEDSLDALKRLYVTKGGYSQKEVDATANELMNLFNNELQTQIQPIVIIGVVGANVSNDQGGYSATMGYRLPVSGPRRVILHLSSAAPARAAVDSVFGLEVPKDCGKEDDIIIKNLGNDDRFEVRITDLVPTPSGSLQMMLTMFSRRVCDEALALLAAKASQALNSGG